MSEIVEKVKPIILECADKLNLEIVDIEWVKENGVYILRILADTEVGLTIDESANLNELVSEKLDSIEIEEDEYFLEVSSPGLERPIKTDADLFKAIGKYINVKTYQKINNVKEFEGYLKSFENEKLLIECNIKGRIQNIEIEKNKISQIRHAIKF